MSKKFNQDEFDLVKTGGGKHRAQTAASARILGFATYLVSVAIISTGGIVILNKFSSSAEINPNDIQSLTTTVTTQTFNGDGLGIMVIDNTSAAGLAGKVAKALYDDGFNVYGAANSGLATPTQNVSKTTVFYNSDSAKSDASDVLKKLGNFQLVKSAAFVDPITVVIAKDYK